MENNKAVCPRCGCESIIYRKKGYSVAKVLVLTVLTLGIFGIWALLAGMIGRNKIIATCAKCGKTWKV